MLRSLNCSSNEDLTEHIVHFHTSENIQLRFICSETSENYVIDTSIYEGYILLLDLTSVVSYKYAKNLCGELIRRSVDRKSIVLVGNKDDLASDRKVLNIAAAKEYDVSAFEISAESSSSSVIQKPFLALAKTKLKKPSLKFLEDLPSVSANAPAPERDSTVNAPSTSLEMVSTVLDRASGESREQLPKTVPVKALTPSLELVSGVL
ncbi:hypothetical protein MKW94_030558, partial [Papaver nudicaule]|nr:hypothetical protein [Papaver nudicaule]